MNKCNDWRKFFKLEIILEDEKGSKTKIVEILKIGEILRNRYKIEKRLGHSDYNQIYRYTL